jgi:hypothetical protein
MFSLQELRESNEAVVQAKLIGSSPETDRVHLAGNSQIHVP